LIGEAEVTKKNDEESVSNERRWVIRNILAACFAYLGKMKIDQDMGVSWSYRNISFSLEATFRELSGLLVFRAVLRRYSP
jgi:hypothetical protein